MLVETSAAAEVNACAGGGIALPLHPPPSLSAAPVAASSQVVLPPPAAGSAFCYSPPSQPVVLVGGNAPAAALCHPRAGVPTPPPLPLPAGTQIAAAPLEGGAPVLLPSLPASANAAAACALTTAAAPAALAVGGGPVVVSPRGGECVRVVENTVVAPVSPLLPPPAQQQPREGEETLVVSETVAAAGPGGAALVTVEEERAVAQPIIRMGRETVIIPAHTFAPKLIFLGEQWLPAPTETHANIAHSVPLAERARFSRKDPQKSESYARQVYAQVAANTVQFEKVLLSSKGTEKLFLTSADREHVRLQATALTEILPSLQMITSATEVQHMRYSLVDYSLASLSNISTQAIQQVVGDHCQQPVFAIVRVYEHTKLPDITPPPSPSHGCRLSGGPVEDCDGWTLLYESPPVELGDRSRVSSGCIKMHEGARFYYKHRIVPPKPRLFDDQDLELHAVLPPKVKRNRRFSHPLRPTH